MIENNINIKTSNPVNDGILNKPKIKTEQMLPFDVVDPTRVTKPSKQDPSNQTGQNLFNYNPDSVFEKFIKSLQNAPVLAEGARKLLLNKPFINQNIMNDPVLKGLFESFLSSIEMNDIEILNFLKFQQENFTKFNGEFFDSLRSLLKSDSQNADFKSVLKNFLKSYDCFVSVEKTNDSISSSLKNIEHNLPEMLKKPFSEMADKLIFDSAKSSDINLSILKNEIVPFLGRYISKMNDFGPVRDYISVLIHNMVRLEGAGKDYFADDLDNLLEYVRFNFDVDEKYMENLKMSLVNTYESATNVKNNSVDLFIRLIEAGTKESNNLVGKGVMEDVTESLLFNQNVHIPLTHMFLPVNYNGMFMFSELWIGKEYEEVPNKKKKPEYQQTYKVFITFDIQKLGYFETTLVLRESGLALDIYVPGALSPHIEKIKNDLNTLLNGNNLNVKKMEVRECVRKRKFNEVFSNLTERKIGVDVTI